jgi:hypothetical protein
LPTLFIERFRKKKLLLNDVTYLRQNFKFLYLTVCLWERFEKAQREKERERESESERERERE